MKRTSFLVVLSLLLLAGCSGGDTGMQKFAGTNGLVIFFVPGIPLDIVREGLPFPVAVAVHNQGALDVNHTKMLFTFSADPLYIEIDQAKSTLNASEVDRSAASIQGKSYTYKQGERRMYFVPSAYAFRARPVLGTREEPKIDLTASICYESVTTLTSSICVDTNEYELNERAQVCTGEDLTFGNGQGAPIAITKIEVDAYPIMDTLLNQEAIRPVFIVTIEDVGGGRLIGPATLDMKTACILKDIPREHLGSVHAQMWMLNTELECEPVNARLFERKGEVRCMVPVDKLADPVYSAKQNFQTTLTVNLSYIYKSSTTREITIKRGAYDIDVPLPGVGKVKGYHYEGDQIVFTPDGRRETWCEYYAKNPAAAPNDLYRSVMTPEWGCSCTEIDCRPSSMECLGSHLCNGDLFCCGKKAEPPASS